MRWCALASGCLYEPWHGRIFWLVWLIRRPIGRCTSRSLIRAAIATGELQPGEQVPSEHELVAEYGVPRGTARQAIMLLRNEGLIEAIHGLGSSCVSPSRSSGCDPIASRTAGRSAATPTTHPLTMTCTGRSGDRWARRPRN